MYESITARTSDSLDEKRAAGTMPRVSEELRVPADLLGVGRHPPIHPILYASPDFNMTGYSSNKVVGRNWAPGRTLQRSPRSGRRSQLAQTTAAIFSTTRRTAHPSEIS